MMESAGVSLHRLPAPIPPPGHHRLPIPAPHTTRCRCPPPSVVSSACRLTTHQTARSAHASSHPAVAHHSGRAATGYAAALADACVRAGTLRRASRHARALLLRRRSHLQELDARVAALVKMLLGKGKAEMVAEVMAEFAAICDHLMPQRAQYLG
jgi:hypothetical protein